jgi:hypothetical protein
MVQPRRALAALLAVLPLVWVSSQALAAQKDDEKKPSLSLKANPPLGFSPLRVRVGVDVRGGPDDYEEFYCPTVEWDWGDGTVSSTGEDCDPYASGQSEIRRRYSAEHTFRYSGAYRVSFRLKQRDKVVASAAASVQVRSGAREDFGR